MTDNQTREYVRNLYKKVYKRFPNEQEEREFAQTEVFPVLEYLYKETQKAKETA